MSYNTFSEFSPSVSFYKSIPEDEKVLDGIVNKAEIAADSSSARNENNINSFEKNIHFTVMPGLQARMDEFSRLSPIVAQFFYNPALYAKDLLENFVRRFLTVARTEKVDPTTSAYQIQAKKQHS